MYDETYLNLDNYSGFDEYSDGNIEDELLSIVSKHDDNYERELSNRRSWPVLYHLSIFRENIINWYPLNKEMEVLEIGSGCGAITGALARRTKNVTCIELSKKRSLININKNYNNDNIEIMVGNFQKIEPKLIKKYDLITLIGVFEYSESYLDSDRPYLEMLELAKSHLKESGKILIAIENRLGLKYWAGCKEDHVGKYFEGIEGYPTSKGVKTFTKKELVYLFGKTGLNYKFYYPYPDYKFMTDIYSDDYLPTVNSLSNNLRNFDHSRVTLFDENKVFDSIIENGLFSEFSNSFFISLGKE